MKDILLQLLKPDGIYSMRRAVSSVTCVLLVIYVIVYLINPSVYDTNVISILALASGVGQVATAYKKYDTIDKTDHGIIDEDYKSHP